MSIAAKESKIMSTEKRSDNLHKASSILSVAAILLSIALFVRMEAVVHDTKMMDSKFTLQIQQIKDALDKKEATYQARANDNIDIVSGVNSQKEISRRKARSNRQNTNAPQEIGDGIKKYVASTVTDSVQSQRVPKDTAGVKGERVPPKFIETPAIAIRVKADSVASVSCRASGFPSPSIVWTRGLVPLPQGRTTVKNGTLTISNFNLEDAGVYQCKATNKLGSVTASTSLVYKDTPDFWKISVIIAGNTFYQKQLNQFLTPAVGNRPQWLLCYRASTHGWAASTFHSRCNGKHHTVTIIKNGQYVFGGYTDIPWEFSGGRSPTSNSFIFSLRNKEGLLPSKSIVKNPSHAIYRYPNYGPTFGYGHDIYIANNANSNTNSYADFGHSYSVPSRVKDKQTFLAGSLYFTPDEVEVFYLG